MSKNTAPPDVPEFRFTYIFIINEFQVFIWYAFIMNSSYENINACKEWLASNMNSVPNEFEFSAQIVPGDNASCPDLEWENVMDFPEGTYLTNGTSPSCSGNYFISPLDSSVCRKSPLLTSLQNILLVYLVIR